MKLDDEIINLGGVSLFKFIPENIGQITYCDTDNFDSEPKSKKEKTIQIVIASSILILLLTLQWVFLYTYPILSTIVTLILIFIYFIVYNKIIKFAGTDYFVGSEGFSIVDFVDSRDNVTVSTYKFKNIDFLLTGETKIYRNGSYTETEYFFSFYPTVDNYGDKVTKIVGEDSTFDENNRQMLLEMFPDQDEDGKMFNVVYDFWKKVEKTWIEYKSNILDEQYRKNGIVSFPICINNECFPNAISIGLGGVYIAGIQYDVNSINKIQVKNGEVTFENSDYSNQFLGLKRKGNKICIPLKYIGNSKIFLNYLSYTFGTTKFD